MAIYDGFVWGDGVQELVRCGGTRRSRGMGEWARVGVGV